MYNVAGQQTKDIRMSRHLFYYRRILEAAFGQKINEK